MTGPRFFAIAVVLWLAVATGTASAQPKDGPPSQFDPTLPVFFKADEIRHDRTLGIVVARGHVEIAHGDRILLADTVSYNQGKDLLTASGHISLLEPSGDVMFADHLEITGDLKNGVVENIRVRLADNSRFAAVGGRLTGGSVTEMRKGVYSPCELCAKDPSRPPLWQLKAQKVIHDRDRQIVEYEDAFLEMFGVPVAYLPYLSHPDPTVKRKSGFLAPSYGSESTLGLLVEVPYYWNIAPDKDATFSPVFTTKEGAVLAGEYRQRFTDGKVRVQASATRGSDETDKDRNRGHLFGDARFDLNDTWRTGADIQVSSDDTYLRRYRYFSGDTLSNHLFIEGFRGRNYAIAQGYRWRGLKSDDDPGNTPVVAPKLSYGFIGDPGRAGGHWNIDADLMALTRSDGADSRRLSLVSGWQLPHIARTGEVYNLYATLQTDAYWVNGVQETDHEAGDTSTGFAGRVFPRVGLDWRYPFARVGSRTTQIIEPLAGIALSPNGGNPSKAPNEDSVDFEFDDTNLLSPNRFGGIDRVEGGQRVHYGLRAGLYGPGSAYATAFIGQSYRFREDDTFAVGSGLDEQLSDFVGRLQINPNAPLSLLYRFRLDKDNLEARRNEVQFTVGPRALNLNVGYIFVDQRGGTGEFGTREELNGQIRSQITRYWSVAASARRDLTEGGGALSHGFNVTYEDECYAMKVDFTRTFTRDRDIEPSDTIFLRLVFKHLGEVKTTGSP